MIPNHFHLIWMGQKFPFVNRLAVESILQTNPEAKVTLHYLDPPSNEHWKALQGRIEFKEIDFEELTEGVEEADGLKKSLDALAENYPAGRSNLYRYLILHRFGGIYADFDTLTLQSLEPLLKEKAFIGEEYVFRSNEARVQGRFSIEFLWTFPSFGLSWALTRINSKFLGNNTPLNMLDDVLSLFWKKAKLNNAVLACEPGHDFFKKAIELIPSRDPSIKFNLGPMLMNDIWNHHDVRDGMRRLKPSAFYYIPPSKTSRFFAERQYKPLPSSYMIHWCSSNEKEKAALLLQEYLSQPTGEGSILFHQLAYPFIQEMPK